jgi:mRNA interferase MazF
MKKGDIVSVIFPFTDLSSSKQRPALVLYVAQEDAILAFITSKISFQHTSDIAIKQSLINNLKTDSLIIVR